MKGEQREERIPNFIGNAVIILTAAHLGCEVEMLTTAQEVWRTKRLAEQADRLREIFYKTGEFPPLEEDNT